MSSKTLLLFLAEISENGNLEDLFKQFAAEMPLRGYKLLQVIFFLHIPPCNVLMFLNLTSYFFKYFKFQFVYSKYFNKWVSFYEKIVTNVLDPVTSNI